jgi:thioredoxin 1
MLKLNNYITAALITTILILSGTETYAATTRSSDQKSEIYKVPSNESNFNKIITSQKIVVVDFYADWCNPCRRLQPVFEQVAREMKGSVTFVKINVDQFPNLKKKYHASPIPTVILFKDGKEIQRRVGACDARTLKSFISGAH